MELNRRDKQRRARVRVAKLKGFYIHGIVYTVVNLSIITTTLWGLVSAGISFSEALLRLGTWVTPFFWGIGLLLHATRVYQYNLFFNKDWEERQIQKFIKEDL